MKCHWCYSVQAKASPIIIWSTCDTDPTLRGKHKSEQSWGLLYMLHVWGPAMPSDGQIRTIKYVSYLAAGLNLLLRLLLLRLLGNHGGCHILACILRAHWLLMEEWKKNEEVSENRCCCHSCADWPDCWWRTFALTSSPRQRQTGGPVYSGHPEPSSVTLRRSKKRGEETRSAEAMVLHWLADLQVGSDIAVWEDLRELRDDTEGVRLWLKRSRTSFRLEVLSWDSEPESWDCCDGKRTYELHTTQIPQIFQEKSHLCCCHLGSRFFYTKLPALLCSYFSIAVGWSVT